VRSLTVLAKTWQEGDENIKISGGRNS